MSTTMRSKAFFDRFQYEPLSYDDVLLRPGYSEVPPADVDVATRFSRNISLPIPLVSAPMDRVTDSRLAIALAVVGGIGVIHRALKPRQQARHVARVKHYMNGVIERPICVQPDMTIAAVLALKEEKGYSFDSFPVTSGPDGADKLVGVLTGNDFSFCQNRPDLRVRDAMTKTPETAPADTDVGEAYRIMCEKKKKVLPLCTADGELRGLYVFSDVERIATGSSISCNTDRQGRLRVAAAIGTGEEALERARLLAEEAVDVLVLDTAHGDSDPVYDTLKILKSDLAFQDVDVVVGNVSEGEGAKRLVACGADGVKVGQGVGSICTTRIISGVGMPQLSAVYQCAQVVPPDVPIIADGGIEYSGQITKAIGAGAACVMIGGLFAGTKESPGELAYVDGISYKDYRGMGSEGAMMELSSSRERYRSMSLSGKTVPEGVEGLVPYRGDVADLVHYLIGGLRSGMGYVGADSIQDLQEKAAFVKITTGGQRESHVHGVLMTRDAPNYERPR